MNSKSSSIRSVSLMTIVFVLAFALPSVAGDEDIFSAQVPPNVLLMIDNSGSMNAVMEHPSFDSQTFAYTCDIMPTIGTGTITLYDELGQATRRVCASSGCRLEVHSSDSGWVATSNPTRSSPERLRHASILRADP